MASGTAIISGISKAQTAAGVPKPRTPPPSPRTRSVDDITFARRIYGFLTVVFVLLGLGLFFYFALQTCGATGIVIASIVTVMALWAFVRFVLLS